MSGLVGVASILFASMLAYGAAAQGLAPSGPRENPETPSAAPGGRISDAPASHIACFNADKTSGFLRIEWPQSGRWAIHSWAKGSRLHIYIGPPPAVWCWAAKLQAVMNGCVKEERFTKPVRTGCGPES